MLYRVNKPDVILEDFSDEVVIVNLASGNYYSIDAVGAAIWTMIQKQTAVRDIAVNLSRSYEGDPAAMEQAVMKFIDELLAENLIVPDATLTAESTGIDPVIVGERASFVPPALNKYTDMQELLLVDPIHEVDETGWPNLDKPLSKSSTEPEK
jgi:hypothetical protein